METKNNRILLVEDDAIIALNQKMQLEKQGYQVLHSSTGEKAIDIVNSHRDEIDLILMDIDLGKGIDGTEAAEKILKKKEVPILFLSSHTEPAIVNKTEIITSYGYVVKNSGITVLHASIKMAFKLFSAHKDIQKHRNEAEEVNESLKLTNKNLITANKKLKRLERAIESTEDVIFITDLNGIITFINSQFTKIYGFKEDEIIGKANPRILNLINYSDEENTDFWNMLKEKHHHQKQFLNRSSTGEILTVEVTFAPIFDKNGDLKEFVQIHRDITQKLSTEEKLIQREDYLKFFSQFALEQANTETLKDLSKLILKQLMRLTNAIFVTYSDYDYENKILKNLQISTSKTIINSATKIAGKQILKTEVPVDENYFQDIVRDKIKTYHSLYEDTNGAVNQQISNALNKILKINEIWGLSYSIGENLYGVSAFAIGKNQTAPDKRVLEAFINLTAISQRRILLEKKYLLQIEELKKSKIIQKNLSSNTVTMESILDNYNESIWSVDKKLNYTFINTYFRKDYKEAYSIELTPGMYALSMTTKKQQNFWRPKYLAALKGERVSFDFTDGTLRNKKYFRINLNPIHSRGVIIGVSGISIDITKQTLTELEVKKTIERSQQYLDLAGVMFAAINKEGIITLVNKKLCEISAYREDELLGQNWIDLMIPENLKKEIIPLFQKFLSGELTTVKYNENPILTKTGEEKLIAWHNTILKDDEGNINGHLSSGTDITDQKKTENEIRKLLIEKELILQEVHHRIKNNMNTLISLISLQTSTVKSEETLNALLEIENRVRSMMVLYNTLYQSSDFQSASVKHYFSALIDNIIENFPNSNLISVKKDIADFQLDAKTIFNLGIIINEILTNSMKYAFNDNSSGELHVSVKFANNNLQIIIADNGIGFPDNINLNDNPGFGLKLIKMLVQQMEGSIRVENKKGSKFFISFKK
jgi:PAS domain S-box-containing protein